MATVLNARLNQVIAVDGEPRSFFFNGRLLSAEDLTREQAARDGAERRLARLIGCGVAEGLTVTAGVSRGEPELEEAIEVVVARCAIRTDRDRDSRRDQLGHRADARRELEVR